MFQSQHTSEGTRGEKQSQEEKDRALAERLDKQLNGDTSRHPPGGSTSLDEEEDLYIDNGYHLYHDDQLDRSTKVIAGILQTDAIVPDVWSSSVDTKTDLAIALELQQAEMGAVSLSDGHIASEIARQEESIRRDSVLAREIAEKDISNQLQVDEEMARTLSQAESQHSERHKQATIPSGPSGQNAIEALAGPFEHLMQGMVNDNNNQPQHQSRRRERRGGRHGHWARQQRHQEEDEDSYESLLELEERIGDVEGQGLNSDQLNMLPVSKYTGGSREENECKVCFSNFELNETVRTLPCCHLFHRDCIDNWIKDHNSCPICRKGIREELHH